MWRQTILHLTISSIDWILFGQGRYPLTFFNGRIQISTPTPLTVLHTVPSLLLHISWKMKEWRICNLRNQAKSMNISPILYFCRSSSSVNYHFQQLTTSGMRMCVFPSMQCHKEILNLFIKWTRNISGPIQIYLLYLSSYMCHQPHSAMVSLQKHVINKSSGNSSKCCRRILSSIHIWFHKLLFSEMCWCWALSSLGDKSFRLHGSLGNLLVKNVAGNRPGVPGNWCFTVMLQIHTCLLRIHVFTRNKP